MVVVRYFYGGIPCRPWWNKMSWIGSACACACACAWSTRKRQSMGGWSYFSSPCPRKFLLLLSDKDDWITAAVVSFIHPSSSHHFLLILIRDVTGWYHPSRGYASELFGRSVNRIFHPSSPSIQRQRYPDLIFGLTYHNHHHHHHHRLD